MRVGLDFDNTIADYDDLFANIAVEEGYFNKAPKGGKRAIRNALRSRSGGERDWRRLQALTYGSKMAGAKLFEHAHAFFMFCRYEHIDVFIISHKTRHPAFEEIDVDLRKAALSWMSQQGFFSDGGFALDPEHVFFTDTRLEKVQRIRELNCSVFVDDLEEVFNEACFPTGTHRILFAPDGAANDLSLTVCRNWSEIADEIVGQSAVA